MNLKDMKSKNQHKHIAKLVESRFGTHVDFDKMTVKKARKMAAQITETIDRVRRSSKIHTAERNPKYMEMLMIREGIECWLSSKGHMLAEDEISQAEVFLAAKGLVDQIQDMVKTIGEMQNEQLPALLDSIRGQVGTNEATAFKTSVGGALSELATQLSHARESVDAGVRSLTGEEAAPGTDDGSLGGDFDELPDEDFDDELDIAEPAETPLPRARR